MEGVEWPDEDEEGQSNRKNPHKRKRRRKQKSEQPGGQKSDFGQESKRQQKEKGAVSGKPSHDKQRGDEKASDSTLWEWEQRELPAPESEEFPASVKVSFEMVAKWVPTVICIRLSRSSFLMTVFPLSQVVPA